MYKSRTIGVNFRHRFTVINIIDKHVPMCQIHSLIHRYVAKCHSMRVTRHLSSNQIHFNYSLHQQTMEQVRSAQNLGLTIAENVEWGQLILIFSEIF